MLYLVVAVAALALVSILVLALRQERAPTTPAPTQDSWSVSQQACSQDLLRLRADVAHLDAGGDPGIGHHVAALQDLVAQATTVMSAATTVDDLIAVGRLLAQGREGLDRIAATVADDDPPAHRPMCFFNPNHGLSETTVSWTSATGDRLRVPCCAADALRLGEGADAYVRTMKVGTARLPWWQVEQCGPWARGWFAEWQGHPVMTQLVKAAPMLAEDAGGDVHQAQRFVS